MGQQTLKKGKTSPYFNYDLIIVIPEHEVHVGQGRFQQHILMKTVQKYTLQQNTRENWLFPLTVTEELLLLKRMFTLIVESACTKHCICRPKVLSVFSPCICFGLQLFSRLFTYSPTKFYTHSQNRIVSLSRLALLVCIVIGKIRFGTKSKKALLKSFALYL